MSIFGKDEEAIVEKSELVQAMVEAMKEFKKPDQEEQAKRDVEKLRLQRNRENLIAAAKQEAENKNNMQRMCSHQREDGRWNTGGQMFNDGMARLICMTCHKVFEFKPAPENARLLERGDLVMNNMAPPRDQLSA